MIWPFPARRPLGKAATPRFAVDRFSLLDGCVVAAGWTDGEPPELMYRGRPVRNASCEFVARADLAAAGLPSARGFRLSAALGSALPRAADLVLRLGLVEVAAVALSAPYDGRPGSLSAEWGHIFGRFRAALSGPARVLEIGSRARSGNTYRNLFPPEIDYVGFDIAPGPNVDVVGDAHHLSRHVDGPFDLVYSISTFEHLLMPWKVALEMNAVMGMGGLAYIQSHAAWPLHDEPWDFFRFSREAWRGLFNLHTGFEVLESGYSLEAAVVPRHAGDDTLAGLDRHPTYLLSGCLARKVSEPRVSWDAEAGDVYDLAYTHR